jgi:hypothetical protein
MFTSIFIQKIQIKNEQAVEAVVAYLITHNKRLNLYTKVYSTRYESYRTGKYGLVPFEKFGLTSIIFLTKKKYLRFFRLPFVLTNVNDNKDTKDSADDKTSKKTSSTFIYCIKGTLKIDELFHNAIAAINKLSWDIEEKEQTSRFNIFYFPERNAINKDERNSHSAYPWFKHSHYRILGLEMSELGRDLKSNGKALDSLFFPDDVKELIRIIGLWVKSKEWYFKKNIPWKRGWLLYGPPGTGKTALARAFAEDLDLPLYNFSLAELSNIQFIKAWQSMQLNVPCIALIEDIDNVFNQRKNIHQNSLAYRGLLQNSESKDGSDHIQIPLTFDTLINCIDGIDKTDGVFTIITTNDLSKIDPSIGIPKLHENGKQEFISSRPGRIDEAIELTYMTKKNKLELARKIVGEFKEVMDEVIIHIEKDIEETPAQFQEYCSQLALKAYWNKSDNLKLVEYFENFNYRLSML